MLTLDMLKPNLNLAVQSVPEPTVLLDIQMLVARRADVLARRVGPGCESDRQLWLRAELEVFSQANLDAQSRLLVG